MVIEKTSLEGCLIIRNKIFDDDRGFFLESFNKKQFLKETGVDFEVKQINFAKSQKNVLRGLHYQLDPYAQAKLVGVIQGAVLDVVVDLRRGSSTFGQSFSFILDNPNINMLVPRGFAHGYKVVSDDTLFYYGVDNYYAPEFEKGISYNDPALGIDWKGDENIISGKDLKHPRLGEAEMNFDKIEIQ
ncbi:MAG: dTDP-4-dehydrorhamnose 3,5-epimerase [Cytophagales bacterium]|nr:dTDP-4-dehydrorhamnose 3,5-epimerase [Cytophagales bacterium]